MVSTRAAASNAGFIETGLGGERRGGRAGGRLRSLCAVRTTNARLFRASSQDGGDPGIIGGRSSRRPTGRGRQMTARRAPHRFTVPQYEKMVHVGILDENDRVELIRGEIVAKMPIGDPHIACV